MRITSLCSPRSGNPVADQIQIETGDGRVLFKSYDTIIAEENRRTCVTTLSQSWDCSRTTLRYLAVFLDERDKAAISAGIKAGRYVVTDEELKA